MGYLIFLIIYLLNAWLVFKVALKLKSRQAIIAWFPFLADYLITTLAGKPFYWLILMYIPGLNIYFDFILWKKILAKYNLPPPVTILMLIPFINFILLAFLAFVIKVPGKASEGVKTAISQSSKES